MKLKRLTFRDSDDGTIPSRITVEMTAEEALWLATVTGACIDTGNQTSNIFDCLVGDVFNRYFEDGVNEAKGYYHLANAWPKQGHAERHPNSPLNSALNVEAMPAPG